jgi:hypothetical protein
MDSWDNYAGLLEDTPGGAPSGIKVGPDAQIFTPRSEDGTPMGSPRASLGDVQRQSPPPLLADRRKGTAAGLRPLATADLQPRFVLLGDDDRAESTPGLDPMLPMSLGSPGVRASPAPSSASRMVELGEDEVVVPLNVLTAAEEGLRSAAEALVENGEPIPAPTLGISSLDDPHIVRVATAVDIFEQVKGFRIELEQT